LNKSLQKKPPEILEPPTKAQKEEAHKIHQQILAIMNEAHAKEAELQSSYIKLGSLIFTMQAKSLWIPLNYSTWTEYFTFLQEKFDSSRSSLYAYMSIAKTLQPIVGEKKLLDMGVTKAGDLKKAVVASGKAPSPEILAQAVNPKISTKQFRQDLFEEMHVKDHNEKGTWFDMGGFYLTPDEKIELLETLDLAKNIDPPIPNSLPEHVQRKAAIMRLVHEFKSTWGNHDQ
jgi:hypothetical protein